MLSTGIHRFRVYVGMTLSELSIHTKCGTPNSSCSARPRTKLGSPDVVLPSRHGDVAQTTVSLNASDTHVAVHCPTSLAGDNIGLTTECRRLYLQGSEGNMQMQHAVEKDCMHGYAFEDVYLW